MCRKSGFFFYKDDIPHTSHMYKMLLLGDAIQGEEEATFLSVFCRN